ncbi:MAG: hypothetical protein Q8K70_03610, partial [Bacteroidota bacterium]|nr:hypothetical protein [Bacteroidota bacterium]
YSCQLPYSNTSILWVFSYPFNREVITAQYDSLTVKNKTYYNVVVFENTRESDHSLIPMNDKNYNSAYKLKYFWAKNYGIIKIESLTSNLTLQQSQFNSWELMKSNIIQ